MKPSEISKLVQLRKYVIEAYNSLDGSSSPGTALIKQADVAYTLESVVRSLDDLLNNHVSFADPEIKE